MRKIFLLIFLFVVVVVYGQEIFQTYKVNEIYCGKKHTVNFESNRTARVYRTVILENYRLSGVNFAGHYFFVYWGCGSPCAGSAIVDVITGKVYDGPDSAFGYKFEKDSRLVIVNPRGRLDNQKELEEVYQEEKWVWAEKSNVFVKLE
jgi:hypothetical protein